MQQSYRNRQRKPPRAGAAGVEVEDAVLVFQVGTVGVAEDDRADAGGGRVQVEAEEFVEDVDEAAAHFHHPGLGKVRGPIAPVGVAPDRVHRGDPFQGAQNLGVADIPGVDDEFDAL